MMKKMLQIKISCSSHLTLSQVALCHLCCACDSPEGPQRAASAGWYISCRLPSTGSPGAVFAPASSQVSLKDLQGSV